jgi:fructose-1,6-bisphosphatase/inositol monophosphatase family enzyme
MIEKAARRAVATLLVREAGGVVTDLTGEPWRPGHTGVAVPLERQ